MSSVAKVILNDFQRGKLPYFVKPPAMVSLIHTIFDGATPIHNHYHVYTCTYMHAS